MTQRIRKDAKDKDFAFFLAWPDTKETMKILGWEKVDLDQVAVGHPVKRPTTLLTDIDEVKQLYGLVDDRILQQDRHELSLQQRIEQSRSWAAWADGLKWVLRVAAKRLKDTPMPAVKTVNLPKKEMEPWRRHFAAGHIPYRKDCGVCVQAAGRRRARRKVLHPEAFCLSIDTAGPFCTGHRYDQPCQVLHDWHGHQSNETWKTYG